MSTIKDLKRWYDSFAHCKVGYCCEQGIPGKSKYDLMELGYKGKVVLKAIGNDFVPQDSLQNQLGMFGLAPEAVFEALKEVA